MPVVHGKYDPILDLVFVLDCTGSMSPYIKEAAKKIKEISQKIFSSKLLADNEDLQVGIVAFRDYAPQDHQEWTYKVFPFTSDMNIIEGYLSGLTARGGGDGPEAVATALYEAVTNVSLAWRPNGVQVIVLITDAPPHGLLDPKVTDGFPRGDPHPLFNPFPPAKLLQLLKKESIHIMVAQCEPTLTTNYKVGASFYRGLTLQTSGRWLPLGNAEVLADSVLAFALETLDLHRILGNLGGGNITNPTNKNFKFAPLFRAVTGKQPTDAEVEAQLIQLYEDPPDDLAERLDMVTAKKSPEEAIAELRAHLKDEVAHSASTNVSHSFSAEGRHNVETFMRAHITGSLDAPLKEDHGTCLVGDCASQKITITPGSSLSDGQIKRLAYIYASRFDKS